jgi:hypothetical protein
VAEGKDRPPSAAAAHVLAVGYDVELERRRLEFETRKFELEEARRKEELEREEKRRREEAEAARLREEKEEARRKEAEAARLREERQEARRREELEREEARRREEREWEEARRRGKAEFARLREEREEARSKEMRDLQEQELQIQRDQWEWQKSLSVRDREKQQVPAAQIKFFGSVLKNVMPKFPSDVADVPMFFEGVEKLFSSFEVADDLKAKLLLPYLNDKAKSLLLRLGQAKQEKYSEVKAFLLNEFKLTRIQFEERFDRATRNKDETCTMFCSHLKNLLTYYCNSRQVKENFKTLFSLLIADKIKSTLPEACLDHVLTSEGDKWLECEALANVVDIYFANHTIKGQPKSVRSDFRRVGNNTVDNSAHKSNSSNAGGDANNRMNASTSSFRDGRGAANASGSPTSTGKGGLCYTCHSPGHKQANYPLRSTKDRASDARVAARNFACAVETPVRGTSASLPLSQLSTQNDVEGKRDRQPHSNDTSPLSNVYRADSKTRSTCNTGDRRMPGHDSSVYAETTPKSQTQQPAVTSQASPVVDTSNAMAYRSARAMVSDHVDTNACNIIADKLSKLNYVPVCMHYTIADLMSI